MVMATAPHWRQGSLPVGPRHQGGANRQAGSGFMDVPMCRANTSCSDDYRTEGMVWEDRVEEGEEGREVKSHSCLNEAEVT